jgi:hypothetical protein
LAFSEVLLYNHLLALAEADGRPRAQDSPHTLGPVRAANPCHAPLLVAARSIRSFSRTRQLLPVGGCRHVARDRLYNLTYPALDGARRGNAPGGNQDKVEISRRNQTGSSKGTNARSPLWEPHDATRRRRMNIGRHRALTADQQNHPKPSVSGIFEAKSPSGSSGAAPDAHQRGGVRFTSSLTCQIHPSTTVFAPPPLHMPGRGRRRPAGRQQDRCGCRALEDPGELIQWRQIIITVQGLAKAQPHILSRLVSRRSEETVVVLTCGLGRTLEPKEDDERRQPSQPQTRGTTEQVSRPSEPAIMTPAQNKFTLR